MAHHIAVIDLGKTNSKVALVDTTSGEEINVVKQSNASRSEALYPSLDHESIEAFTIESLRELSRLHSIDAITVATHGATAALLTASGDLALPVLDYEFTGIDELRGEYDKHRPSFSETGSPALPGGLNIGAQLFWQQANYPKQFATAHTLLTWPQYWVHRLTGERYNDVTSLGCHTDLYDPVRQQHSSLIDNRGWGMLMPPIRHPGERCGALSPSMADRISLPKTTPVHIGIHDSNASLVPHLIAQSAPFSVVSSGTWFIAMAMGGIATKLDETRDTLINVNARGESVPSARFMGGRERELLEVTVPVTDQAMDTFLSQDTSAAMLMPSVVADTGPYPNSPHGWSGSNTGNGSNRACATVLYLALMTQECLISIGADGPTFIEGPLAHDKHYTEMLAAVTNRPVKVGKSATGTSVGAAMLISPPVNNIEYQTVQLDEFKRIELSRYATRWKQQLVNHLR